MSESDNEPVGIPDEDLPEDLQPGEDNPLAEPLDTEEVDRDELDMTGGKPAEAADEAGADGDADGGNGGSDEDDTP